MTTTPKPGDVFAQVNHYHTRINKLTVKRVTPAGRVEFTEVVNLWRPVGNERYVNSTYSSSIATRWTSEHDAIVDENARDDRFRFLRDNLARIREVPSVEKLDALEKLIKELSV